MPDASSKKLRKLTLIEGDAGCARQSRFFVLRPLAGQDAVAVSLAAKHQTDGCGFWAAVRNRNLLVLFQQLFVRQVQTEAKWLSTANPSKMQGK
jgi:hypothetical protein